MNGPLIVLDFLEPRIVDGALPHRRTRPERDDAQLPGRRGRAAIDAATHTLNGPRLATAEFPPARLADDSCRGGCAVMAASSRSGSRVPVPPNVARV
jgi:hypothetical protein